MDLTQAFAIVVDEFGRYNLFEKGWTFEWDRSKKRFGYCLYSRKLISMSKELSALNTVEQFIDTLRHEIAHAIVGPGHHHGRTWKLAAIAVGAKPEACYSASVIEGKAPWTGTCQDCGYTCTRHRLTRRITVGSWHTKCHGKGKEFDGNMVWTKNY